MATSTPNYGLIKPGGSDAPDIPGLNPNWDKVDLELKKNADNIGLLGSRTVVFSATNEPDAVTPLAVFFGTLPVGSHAFGGIWLTRYHFTGTIFKDGSGQGVIMIVPSTSTDRAWKAFNTDGGWNFAGIL